MKRLYLLALCALLVIASLCFASCGTGAGIDFVVDGEAYASVDTDGNEAIELPTPPTKEGYVFGGWYYDEGTCLNAFDADALLHTALSERVTVYAKWTLAHAHVPTDWIVDTEATCKELGKKHTECTVCGEIVESVAIEKTDAHVAVTDPRVEPTDSTDGLTEGSHCEVCGKVLVEQTVIPSGLSGTQVSSIALKAEGDALLGACDNTVTSFSFMNDISVAPGATYTVAYDDAFKDVIADKVVPLAVGDNVFYLLVTNAEERRSYTVTVRRLPTYTVRFDTAGGGALRSQTVQEGGLATEPTVSRTGYTFAGWSFDFATPITSDVTAVASWKANTDTPYRVEYYLENVYKTGYEIPTAEELTGTTATTVTAAQKEFAHFRFNESLSTARGTVSPDGSLVLRMYYLRNTYEVAASVDDDAHGTVTGGGTYAYGTDVTLTATDSQGYLFLGWYEGEFTVSREATFTFPMEKGVSYTAKWTEDTNTPYTVEYYLENSRKSGFEVPMVQVLAGTTNAAASAQILDFAHFTFLDTPDNVLDGTIAADGSLVLRVHYARNTYDVQTSVSHEERGSTSGDGNYIYGESVTLNATDRRGYTFLGWYGEDGTLSMDAANATRSETYPYTYTWTFAAEQPTSLVATWALSTNTPYTVEHYLENEDKSGYSAIASEKDFLTGTTLSTVNAVPRTYTHFTLSEGSDSTSTGAIAPDGTLVLRLYYTRNVYHVSPYAETAQSGTLEGTGGYAYDKEITVRATPKPGYEFDGWYSESGKLADTPEYTFRIQGNVEAKFRFDTYLNETFLFTTEGEEWTIEGVRNKALTEITVPYYITSIREGAFAGCSALTSITLPFVGGDASATKTSPSTLFGYIFGAAPYDGATETVQTYDSFDRSATYYIPTTLASVTVTGGTVHGYSFQNCQTLLHATLKGDVREIGFAAFSECKSLRSLSIPDGVTVIHNEAFEMCESLSELYLGESITAIMGHAFTKCTSLVTLDIPSGVTAIEICAFSDCTALRTVNIPDAVETLGYGVFENCTALESIALGSRVKVIPERAFYNCASLTRVTVDKNADLSTIDAYAFSHCTSLTEAFIGDGIRSVRDYAFLGCESLETLELGDGMSSIGQGAFSGCKSLKEVTLSEDLSSISANAFSDCIGIERVNVPSIEAWLTLNLYNDPTASPLYHGNGNLYIDGKPVTEVVLPDGITEIGYYAFAGCRSLERIVLHDGVTSIGRSAFENCTSLTTVELSETSGLRTIITYAFQNCTSLKRFDIPESVTSLSGFVFVGAGLETVTFPHGITKIPTSFLEGCASLKRFTVPEWVTEIGENAFKGCASLEELTVPANVKTVGKDAFVGCSALTSVTVEAGGVTTLPAGVFSGCSSIERMTLPFIGTSAYDSDLQFATIFGQTEYDGSVPAQDSYYLPRSLKHVTITVADRTEEAFKDCTMLESITLPEGVTAIEYRAFSGCESLRSFTIPAGVTTVGRYAFYNCAALASVTIPEGVSTVNDYAFSDCKGLVTVTVPASVTTIGKSVFSSCNKLVEIVNKSSVTINVTDVQVHAGESKIVKESGFLFYASEGVNYLLGYEGDATDLSLPESYHGASYSIYKYAFLKNVSLTSVTIPSRVEKIGSYAFSTCTSLSSLTLNEGLTAIGDSAFYGCYGLTTLVIPDTVTRIDSYAFYFCTGLVSVTVGESVTEIGSNAFEGCNKLVEVINLSTLPLEPGKQYQWEFIAKYAKEIHQGESKIKQEGDFLFYTFSGVHYLLGYVGEDSDVILPESYHGESYEIYAYAFLNEPTLTSVTVPKSVTRIAKSAFRDYLADLTCGTVLTDIYYVGTEEEWNALIPDGLRLDDGVTVHCNDTNG